MAHTTHHTENSGSPIKNVGDDRRDVGDDRRNVGDDRRDVGDDRRNVGDDRRDSTFAYNRRGQAPDIFDEGQSLTSEEYLSKALEVAVTKAVLQASGPSRRQLLAGVGSAALIGLISEFLPLSQLQALAADPVGKPEKTDLAIGFIPITCATPIIMAEPMGFYSKHGLNAKVKRAAGWAMVRDWAINKDVDAAHMLSPMPLAITLGAGSPQVPFYMPAVENINGQAITLHNKHKGVENGCGYERVSLLCAL